MPSRRPSATGKQRVRTGCWTCRRRRRKCDERKPRCENCETKGFSCRYGADLTFVSVSNPGTKSPKGATTAVANNYHTIQFVNDAPVSSTAIQNWEYIQDVQGTNSATSPGASAAQGPITELPVEQGNTDRAETSSSNRLEHLLRIDGNVGRESTLDSTSGSPLRHNREAVAKSRDLHDVSGKNSFRSHVLRATNAPNLIPANSGDEMGLLRYFRYHLAPWIDAGDPECGFEIQALLLAKTQRPLLAAILALALTHSASQQNSSAMELSAVFYNEAKRGLSQTIGPVRSLGETFLMLRDFFLFGPRHWRDLLLSRTHTFDNLGSIMTSQNGLNQPWWLLHFRIDLAACIIGSQAPLMPYSSWLLPDGHGVGSFPISLQQQPERWAYLHALLLLANCLSLLHGKPDTLSSRPEHGRQVSVGSLLQTDFTSRWTSLWTDCQEWYHNRLVEMRPIVDIRGAEAEEIDAENCSSFPILIYTTPLALLANTVYHITSFLLLTHKPRLLKALPGSRCFASRIWHAQVIAGIATSNEFREQWDMILIASLLTIAPEMTHTSQQSILLKQLDKITTVTGIKLSSEIDALRSGWDVSQYDEETFG